MAYNAEDNQNESQNSQSTSNTPGIGAGGGQPLAGSGNTSSDASSRTATYSNGQASNSTGSGRFTNLQKYIGANEGAGDRLYSGINANIDRSTSEDKKDTNTQAQNVGAAVDDAKNKLNTGNQYLNQVGNISTNSANTDPNQANNPYGIANDANTLADFTKYRTNQAIDANGLATQANNAQTTANTYQDALQNNLNQVSTENGRYQLLNSAFGGGTAYKPTYTTGQQRLDNLFLQAGGNNNIANLQNNVQGQINNVNQIQDTLKNQASTIGTIGGQATDLSTQLGDKTQALQQAYLDDMSGRVAGINTDRDNTRTGYTNFVNTLTGNSPATPLNSDLLNQSGLKLGQQTFNVLNPGLAATDVVDYDNRQANDYHDIANQGNVDYYGALAKLAGIDNGNLNTTGMLIDPATGQLTSAANFKTGSDSLTGRIDTARDAVLANQTGFNANAIQQLASGGQNYNLAPSVGATSSNNVANYLNNGNYSNGYLAGNMNDPSNSNWTKLIPGQAANGDNLGTSTGIAQNNLNSYLAGNSNATANGTVANSINQATNSANASTQKQLEDYLATLGFNNYLGANGVQQGASGIANYGYTPGSTNKGFYTPPDDVGTL